MCIRARFVQLVTWRGSNRMESEMTTTPTTTVPDVAPPAGATPDIWEGNPAQRVVAGINRGIDGHDVLVWTATVQYADGSLREPAQVHVELHHDDAMTADQARAPAAQLIEAADEIDGWVS